MAWVKQHPKGPLAYPAWSFDLNIIDGRAYLEITADRMDVSAEVEFKADTARDRFDHGMATVVDAYLEELYRIGYARHIPEA